MTRDDDWPRWSSILASPRDRPIPRSSEYAARRSSRHRRSPAWRGGEGGRLTLIRSQWQPPGGALAPRRATVAFTAATPSSAEGEGEDPSVWRSRQYPGDPCVVKWLINEEVPNGGCRQCEIILIRHPPAEASATKRALPWRRPVTEAYAACASTRAGLKVSMLDSVACRR